MEKLFDINYFERLEKKAFLYRSNNYNYLYLKAMHYKCSREGAEVIIAGSSHTRNAIIESLIGPSVINFSIVGQDLYYACLNIKNAVYECSSKNAIKYCFINMGLFSLNYDLSKLEKHTKAIDSVYYPLFSDAHHCKNYSLIDMWEGIDVSFEEKSFCESWAINGFYQANNIFGDLITREETAENINWKNLSVEERMGYVMPKVKSHEHQFLYEESGVENRKLIYEIVEFLIEHNIRPIFLICPFSKEYYEEIDRSCEQNIVEFLEQLPYEVDYLNMNDYRDIFDDSCFIDPDHCSTEGAIRCSELLNNFLNLL